VKDMKDCRVHYGSRDSAVGIATGYGLDGPEVGVRVPVGDRFSPLHIVQTAYPIGIMGFSPGG
jgi:hypothetical protein